MKADEFTVHEAHFFSFSLFAGNTRASSAPQTIDELKENLQQPPGKRKKNFSQQQLDLEKRRRVSTGTLAATQQKKRQEASLFTSDILNMRPDAMVTAAKEVFNPANAAQIQREVRQAQLVTPMKPQSVDPEVLSKHIDVLEELNKKQGVVSYSSVHEAVLLCVLANAASISFMQALEKWRKGCAHAQTQMIKANAYVKSCNEGKQKLVDKEKKALANLDKEKKKNDKLTKENKSLKASAKKKGKKGTAAASEATAENANLGETNQLKVELAMAEEEVKRLKKDVSLKEEEVKQMEKRIGTHERVSDEQGSQLLEAKNKLLDTERNHQDTVKELSEPKSRIALGAASLNAGGSAPNPGASSPNEGMAALEKENARLKKENEALTKKLEEALAGNNAGGTAKDPHAGMRNADVNQAIEDYVKPCLCRKVIFLPTQQAEDEATAMVWEALKGPQKLETYHQLTKEDFCLYYGPKVRAFVNDRRGGLQADMKRGARGE